MYFIGTALVFLGFLDFGLYVLGNFSSYQFSFMPEVLVLGDKDLTEVAVILVGYFLRGMGDSDNAESAAEAASDSNEDSA
jgi:hypothetical protein